MVRQNEIRRIEPTLGLRRFAVAIPYEQCIGIGARSNLKMQVRTNARNRAHDTHDLITGDRITNVDCERAKMSIKRSNKAAVCAIGKHVLDDYNVAPARAAVPRKHNHAVGDSMNWRAKVGVR